MIKLAIAFAFFAVIFGLLTAINIMDRRKAQEPESFLYDRWALGFGLATAALIALSWAVWP